MRKFSVASSCVCWTLFVFVSCESNAAGSVESGEQIYVAMCADCHGANGEGSKDYDTRRLAGGLSVSQLAVQIRETMPEDDPESLTEEESQAVASYVHDTFYSAIARARNRPARVELARMTVRQYRQAVADLIGSFTRPPQISDQQGLKGEYYRGRRPGGRGRVAERLDPLVDFDFGKAAPVPEIDEPHSFSIRWSGAIQTPETGDYQFIVKTEHAARLWVNNEETPLIDAWVKSGDDTEYKANLYLVAGRVYPLRLEFTKAKQGVDDSKKRKKPESAPAAIALLWERPHGVAQPIPARYLSPSTVADAYVCDTPFPPDDRSLGWERGTTVSKAWDQATTNAGIDAATYIVERINQLAGTKDDASDRTEMLEAFCRSFVERGFRRPLTEELERLYVEKQFAAASDPDIAVKRVVLLVLKSPRFLFREVATERDAYDVAARLSFGLWDTIPDQALLDAARDGRLDTQQQVAAYAEKMLQDPRAKAKLRSFLLTWLKAEAGVDLSKDPEKYPDFDAASIADLRASLELFLDDVVWSDGSDYRQLLLADEVFLNKRLAEFYGAESTEDGFVKVKLDAGKRAGILTHPYVMARFAYNVETSPIHRGVFLARGVLGQSLRPPPAAVAPIAPDLHPDLTTRERVALQTKDTTCMACHSIINPLGFTLEHFDAVGRYREMDRSTPVDVSGSYKSRSGELVELEGARALAEFVAGSEEGHAAFIEQLFHHLVQQPVKAYGLNTLDELHDSFVEHDYNIRKLAVDVMTASVLVGRDADTLAHATTEASATTE